MNDTSITIQDRPENFAIRTIKAYTEINKNNHFYDAVELISKRFFRKIVGKLVLYQV